MSALDAPRARAINILESLTAVQKKRLRRRREFLCSTAISPYFELLPEKWARDWCEGWSFPPVPNMAAALDILLTSRLVSAREMRELMRGALPCWLAEGQSPRLSPHRAKKYRILEWTQGSAFDFHAGYTIYSAPRVRDIAWKDQATPISVSLQITKASPAVPESKDNPRNPGLVVFERRHIEDGWKKAETFSMNQDDFVRLLITGEIPGGVQS